MLKVILQEKKVTAIFTHSQVRGNKWVLHYTNYLETYYGGNFTEKES